MVRLSEENIAFIIKGLHYRGIIYETLQDELVDHICASVEHEMENGTRFIDAYEKVLVAFGRSAGMQETQRQTLQSENQRFRNMLRNYFTIAFRNLKKHRFYTSVNVLGLAVGIASCLIIVLYVSQELRYDRHHRDIDRIYRVDCEIKFGPNHMRLAVSPAPMAEALRQDYPEVETSARLWNSGSMLVKKTDQNIKETEAIYADSSIFQHLHDSFSSGNPKQALRIQYDGDQPTSSRKIFPGRKPRGKITHH